MLKNLTCILLTFAMVIILNVVNASEFPDKTITIVCNWSAGGGQDTVSRLIAKFASERAGVPVVVNNVTGAGGSAGVRFASEAKPDGYTIGIIGSSFVARN